MGQAWLGIVISLGVSLVSAPVQAESESQLKAAFIYNFTKYVLWPSDVEQAGGDLRLCVFGSKPNEALAGIQGRPVRAFHIDVQHIRSEKQLPACHIVFFNDKFDPKLLDADYQTPVLSISDQRNFVEQGGVIELYQQNRRIRFDVNLKQAKDTNIQISAKLLQLAGKVVK